MDVVIEDPFLQARYKYMNFFDVFLVNPIINILVASYQLLSFAHIPYALGFAIVVLTVIVRLGLYPFTAQQLQTSKKMQEMAPHLNKLKEKHKGNARRLQEETMALYKEHQVNPAAGCLPFLVQIVILLFGLYPALQKVMTLKPEETVKTINSLLYFKDLYLIAPWSTDFFGFALGKTPAELFQTMGPIVFIVPVITGFLQLIQSKMMMPAGNIVDEQQKQQSTLYMAMSVMVAFFSYSFSVGLSLYWNTFSIFGIIQQYKMQGLGGLEGWLKRGK